MVIDGCFFTNRFHFFPTFVAFSPGTVSHSPGAVSFSQLILTQHAFFTPNRPRRIGPFPGHINVPSRAPSIARRREGMNSNEQLGTCEPQAMPPPLKWINFLFQFIDTNKVFIHTSSISMGNIEGCYFISIMVVRCVLASIGGLQNKVFACMSNIWSLFLWREWRDSTFKWDAIFNWTLLKCCVEHHNWMPRICPCIWRHLWCHPRCPAFESSRFQHTLKRPDIPRCTESFTGRVLYSQREVIYSSKSNRS